MNFQDLLFFEKMIVPKIITILYWLMLAACVIGGLVAMFTQSFFAGLFGMIFGLIGARVWCELLIVMFKINESLQVIREK